MGDSLETSEERQEIGRESLEEPLNVLQVKCPYSGHFVETFSH